MSDKPLAIDLYCGLGGWTEGLLAEGWDVRGYDIEAHEYGDERYPGDLVVQDILALHGSELADADLIVSSSPCTDYSYMAMPWTRAKAKAAAIRADETGEQLRKLNALFDAQFRLQREASEAAGRHIPMVVENVRGAIPWVGRSKWNYGSYHLWGDIPALMPAVIDARKNPGFRFDGSGRSFQSESVARHVEGMKNADGGSWFGVNPNGTPGACNNARDRLGNDGVKNPGRSLDRGSLKFNDRISNFPPELNPLADLAPSKMSPGAPAAGRKGAGAGAAWFDQNISSLPSGSSRRKAASAKIAKIPFALSSHIARVYLPTRRAA